MKLGYPVFNHFVFHPTIRSADQGRLSSRARSFWDFEDLKIFVLSSKYQHDSPHTNLQLLPVSYFLLVGPPVCSPASPGWCGPVQAALLKVHFAWPKIFLPPITQGPIRLTSINFTVLSASHRHSLRFLCRWCFHIAPTHLRLYNSVPLDRLQRL